MPGISKLVQVSLLDPVCRDDAVLVPMRWEATGPMGRLFPVLDANLMLGQDDQGRAVLRIAALMTHQAGELTGQGVPDPDLAPEDVLPELP